MTICRGDWFFGAGFSPCGSQHFGRDFYCGFDADVDIDGVRAFGLNNAGQIGADGPIARSIMKPSARKSPFICRVTVEAAFPPGR